MLLPVRSDFDNRLRNQLLDEIEKEIHPRRLARLSAPNLGDDLANGILRAACDRDQALVLLDLDQLDISLLPSSLSPESAATCRSVGRGGRPAGCDSIQASPRSSLRMISLSRSVRYAGP